MIAAKTVEDDMREMRRADALGEAVASFGSGGAPSVDDVIARADAFYDWLSRKDPAPVMQLKAARPAC